MDPSEEKIVKLYILSIVSLIALVVVFGTLALVQNSNFASPLTAAASDTLTTRL